MLIGVKDKRKVVLAYSACDIFNPVAPDDLRGPENIGLWRVIGNRHTVMGCGRPTAESDMIRYEPAVFRGELSYDRLLCDAVPAMEELAADKEYIGDDDGRYEEFLIAQNDRLFMITFEHLVREIDDYAAISPDTELIKSVLHATEGEPALDRLRKAFDAVTREYRCKCYPITVIDTASRVLRRIDG